MGDALLTPFSSIILGGAVLLGLGTVWYVRFRRTKREAARYAAGFPLAQCPACGSALQLNEQIQYRLGLPSVTRAAACDRCQTRLSFRGPGLWQWHADAVVNVEIAWLYDGELMTDDELGQLAQGIYPRSAQAKLRKREELEQLQGQERLERQRQMAREAALEAIARGDASRLRHLDPRLVEMPNDVRLHYGPSIEFLLRLKKGEIAIIAMDPVTLGEVRSEAGRRIIETADVGGHFIVTSQRYIYTSPSLTVQRKLSVITACEADRHTLIVRRTDRKPPDCFQGVDARLAAAVMTAMRGLK